ncbi:MAG: hypothetical protein COV91_02865 [Candidatus Taylorbacteria bacterium CG11_big_fil_rev_8_21_14_0_20_46_11]|uniref:ComEC/Rec2-related protein domain-containing protein n=1 Tax=Candidatus Taylorbacteria bacterium CG11_big_fil_rev_8_21_14_0_20_46_11 TaxID=1975025 RepID=A0A2H0KBT3_9BACT|nr:MAG: hypothetical protein COV91_02865 [Candidatus Taylorbacteria bacterium CG11_big_fil_rev_8_21_14_0_20_46_11]
MYDSLLYSVLVGFIGGIALRSFVNLGPVFPVFLLVIAGALILTMFLGFRSAHAKHILLISICLASGALGVLRYDATDKGEDSVLVSRLGSAVSLEGVVMSEPDVRETSTRLVIKVDTVEGSPILVSEKTLVTVSHEPVYEYGDRLLLVGRLDEPDNFTDEITGRSFDYRAYLAKDGIYAEMYLPAVERIDVQKGSRVLSFLFSFKHAFVGEVGELIPEPHASLLGGLVVGAKQSLGKQLLEDFRTVGVIHIVVLSGYNITIIAYFIEWLLSRLRRSMRLLIASLAMILFALMVGAGATVVRATIMALLVVVAKATGRLYDVTRALLVAGAIMLVHNPQILVFDISFQLSFLATVGLIYVSPILTPHVKFVTERLNFREVVVATVSTQLFVLPFILYKMGELSLVALPVNLLILAGIPLTMLFGFLAGVLGFMSTALATPFAFVAYGLLAYELAVVEWFAKLPFASLSIPSFPLWLAVLWYVLYAVLLFMWRNRQSTGILFKEGVS